MKLLLTTICTLGLSASGISLAQMEPQAQPPAQPPEPAVAQPATEVSDDDMQKFAEIYVDVETTRVELAEELNTADEPVAAEDAQVRLQEQLVATIENHGWSVDRYNRVATAISNDPEKRDKAVELINEMISS